MTQDSQSLFRLDGKVAIVTGAARGLGAVIARILARQGATVIATDVQFEEVSAVANEIGPSTRPYRLDVSQVDSFVPFIKSVVLDFGRIDILVNNAGICPRLPFEESTEHDWNKLVAVNAKSQYFLVQAVCPIMKEQGSGRIINVASTGGRTGSFNNASIYSGTKGAIVMFSKSIAREVAKDGILINCIAPGVLDTDLMRTLQPEQIQAICDQIPLKRLGRPEEIAAVVAFMASDECSYATGATFDINGGWVML